MFLFAFLLCVCYCKPIFCICKEIFEEYFNFFCAGKNSGNRPHDNGRTSDSNTADKTQKPADAASEKIVCTGKARRSRQHHKHPKFALTKVLAKEKQRQQTNGQEQKLMQTTQQPQATYALIRYFPYHSQQYSKNQKTDQLPQL